MMTMEEASVQIEGLKKYCEDMADSDESGSYVFDLDVQALDLALTALRPVSREQVERMRGKWMHKEIQSSNSVTGYFKLPECECSNCGCIVQQEANFCPHCGEPKTDEAVDMMMERINKMEGME